MTETLSEQSVGAANYRSGIRGAAFTESQASYGRDIRGITRALWRSAMDESQAYSLFYDTVRLGFRKAWTDGGRSCSIEPADWTLGEKVELGQRTANEIGFILPFLDYVVAHNKAEGFKFGALLHRCTLWTQRYNDLKNSAMQKMCGDLKLRWVKTAKESCRDCIRLGGQVRRASVWLENDLRPQSPRLECMRSAGGATVCKCYFEQTDEPCSRGPLPRI